MDNKYTKNAWDDENYKDHKPFDSEQAATLQNAGDDPVPIFARQTETNNNQKKSFNKKIKLKPFKPVMLAISSAVVIGSILGIIMLRMFVGIESDIAQGNNNLPVAGVDNEDNGNNTEAGLSTFSNGSIDAYVLQGGVFSEMENADEWVENYDQAGLHSLIWEVNDQYFLLVGLANTDDQAKQFANDITAEEGFEVFGKEWNTAEREVELIEEEAEWLQAFEENWHEALGSLENEEIFIVDEWEGLVENYPEETDRLASLNESISSFLDEMEQAEGSKAQNILLNMWYQYDRVIN
ncbi:stage II sporulation protein B [Virgibacillus natechei]|uniref:Stage II sporulation protein B n=1 Tax=Virgibacillus natechei TaxID=1216297 RepID=A0ABS4ICZ9_9BACI|nr:hypothetical protein [Virgibacillus natechei]MBP1968803.1 stage II sporulation protein B [Virgibacillus natechei]UZD11601.1 hypothetical protein OLD84_11595 [Virgibacillus natechei]